MDAQLAARPRPGHARLTIDLDLGADPVAGTLSGGSAAEAFVGWVGLTRAIELALEAARGGAGAPRGAGER